MALGGTLPVVNQGPQLGPLTPVFNGDLVQTPKGLRSLSLEGFSEDLDQDGYVDPIADAVAQVGYAGVQASAHHHHVAAPVSVAAAPVAVAAAPVAVEAARFAPVYNNLAAYGLASSQVEPQAVTYNTGYALPSGIQYANGYALPAGNGLAATAPGYAVNTLPTAAGYAVNTLPSAAGYAVNTLPSAAGYAVNALPAAAGQAVNTLPVAAGYAVNALPAAAGYAVNTLPAAAGYAAKTLPAAAGYAVNTLPAAGPYVSACVNHQGSAVPCAL